MLTFLLINLLCCIIWLPIVKYYLQIWREAGQCEGCLESFPPSYRFHLTDDGVVLCDDCWDEVSLE